MEDWKHCNYYNSVSCAQFDFWFSPTYEASRMSPIECMRTALVVMPKFIDEVAKRSKRKIC